jgi:hypothetical protein
MPPRLSERLFRPIDAASLVFFRISFGLVMAWWCFDDLRTGRVHQLYEVPRFHFTYEYLDFVRPWPGAGMTIHFLMLLMLALCIAAGLMYRLAMILFAVGFTWFFLLDRTNYQNHYYLISLVSWIMALLPLHRQFSLDVLNGFTRPAATLPVWMLWLVRFHIALPYVFGGLAKFEADWLAGEPMRQVFASQSDMPMLGAWLATEWAVQFFTWGGLLFDLSIVPLLLWRPTRLPAYVAAIGFHLANSFLFHIHIFPWFMILASTIFFAPDWPRRLLKRPRRDVDAPPPLPSLGQNRRVAVFLSVVVAFHLIWPLRHHAYGADAAWTERGHYFSWRMMLRSKTSGIRYYMVDKPTGRWWVPDIYEFVNQEQSAKFARDPEMILQFAHFLAKEHRRRAGREAAVHALVLTSLNGRKPQLLIDPETDLAAQPRGFYRRDWIIPLAEKLRRQPWRAPLVTWEQSVAIPRLSFLSIRSAGTAPLIESTHPAHPAVIARAASDDFPSPPASDRKDDRCLEID